MAETLTYGYHRQDGVDVRVARIFNTYGMSIIFFRFVDTTADCRYVGPRSTCHLSRAT